MFNDEEKQRRLMLVTNLLAPLREALAKNDAEQFASKEPEPCNVDGAVFTHGAAITHNTRPPPTTRESAVCNNRFRNNIKTLLLQLIQVFSCSGFLIGKKHRGITI